MKMPDFETSLCPLSSGSRPVLRLCRIPAGIGSFLRLQISFPLLSGWQPEELMFLGHPAGMNAARTRAAFLLLEIPLFSSS